MKIELSQEDFAALMQSLGYATQAAICHGNQVMADQCVFLANQMNKNNPHWIPLERRVKS